MTLFEVDPETEQDAPPAEGAQRVRMALAYDGSGFRGFAGQPRQRTVAGVLAAAIERVVGHTVVLVAAGRTDAGVHAAGQVVHADLVPPRTDTWTESELRRLHKSLTKLLAPEIVVRCVEVAPEGFSARFSATGRTYRYTVLNDPVPDPFLAPTTWHVADPLDLRAMQLSCDPLIGEHDFSAFCRRPPDDGSLVRQLRRAEWSVVDEAPRVLRFEVEASSFCHQMVRSLVGMMVAVGSGRRRAGDMAGVLRSGDRANTVGPAPAHGLCLWRVDYSGNLTETPSAEEKPWR